MVAKTNFWTENGTVALPITPASDGSVVYNGVTQINGEDAASPTSLIVTGGTATAANKGGNARLHGGVPGPTGVGGDATVRGAAGGTTSGDGGLATLTGGAGTAGNANGGLAREVGGAGQGTGAGGAAQVTGGASGAGATGNGGPVNITGGAAASTAGNGGSVIIGGGAKTSTGVEGMIIKRSVELVKQGAPTAATVSATLTAAALLTGIITVLQGAGAASAQQLPLASAMDTAFPDAAAGDAFDFSVINISATAAEAASLTTNTGWTLVGDMDLIANSATTTKSAGRFRARKTGTAAWTLYRLS